MTEPHWPADGSGDEFDGGYDPTAYPPAAASDSHPGDYESPRTAPFVQVRVNGELVPGHIVYPWPDGGLVVEPLEA